VSVVAGYPPNWDAIRLRFGLTDASQLVFTYAPRVYVPSGQALPPDIVIHEHVHLEQQAAPLGPEGWWARFLDDDEWRVEQEVAAYKAQIAHLRRVIRDRNELARCVTRIAGDLAGPMYGHTLTFQSAFSRLIG
jgi:hypothetical protein